MKTETKLWQPSLKWYVKMFAGICLMLIVVYMLFNIFLKPYFRDDVGKSRYFSFITEQK